VHSTGTLESPRLSAELTSEDLDDAAVIEARSQAAWILGTEDDLSAFYRMALAERHLAPLVHGMRGLHVPHTASVYEALVLAILGQQISSHVARVLRTQLVETLGISWKLGDATYSAFPRPEAVAAAGVEGLRAMKLSARKAQYMVDIAASVASGELDLEGLRSRPAEDVLDALTAIRGVGPWTAHWLLIQAVGHTDGFPHGDLALQRFLGTLVNAGAPLSAREALEYSRRWAPHRSYVTTYLFAAARSGRMDRLIGAGEVGS